MGAPDTVLRIGDMASFARSVFGIFNRLQSGAGFVPAKAIASQRFASLVKRVDDDFFLYVFVSDGRPGNASLDVALWAAPPDAPGDSLDNLYVGYKIRIGSSFEVDDAFFQNCERRILTLLPYLEGLRGAIMEELANPAFHTRRLAAYRLERQVFACLQQAAKLKPQSPSAVALRTAADVTKGRCSMEKLEEAATAAVEALQADGSLGSDVIPFFGGEARFAGISLAGHLYTHALGSLNMDRHGAGKTCDSM
jgi:hypothetical protein